MLAAYVLLPLLLLLLLRARGINMRKIIIIIIAVQRMWRDLCVSHSHLTWVASDGIKCVLLHWSTTANTKKKLDNSSLLLLLPPPRLKRLRNIWCGMRMMRCSDLSREHLTVCWIFAKLIFGLKFKWAHQWMSRKRFNVPAVSVSIKKSIKWFFNLPFNSFAPLKNCRNN